MLALNALCVAAALLVAAPGDEPGNAASAWQDLLRDDPAMASRTSTEEQAVLQALTTEQVEAYLSGKPASAIRLPDGNSLEDFLKAQGRSSGFDLSWFTIDGGGGMWSQGGDFELSATIAQVDAVVLKGDDFELTGGFWAIPDNLERSEIFSDDFESGDCSEWSDVVGGC
ncbi:MAG: hypothetical protein GY835_22030 [bacterium]|nr:hypothetical protein [bacterium]